MEDQRKVFFCVKSQNFHFIMHCHRFYPIVKLTYFEEPRQPPDSVSESDFSMVTFVIEHFQRKMYRINAEVLYAENELNLRSRSPPIKWKT